MKKTSLLLAALLANAVCAPANAAVVYMTGSGNPWGIPDSDPGSPETAMNGAFGTGNWTKYQGFDASVFNSSNSFVYIEGGDSSGIADFINGGGRSAIESYVTGGGSVFFNAARNDTSAPLEVAFGATITRGSFCNSNCTLTSAGLAAGLDANGAGTSWSGGSFSHDAVTGLGNALIAYTGGTILADGRFGAGYLMVGGQTAPYFHQPQAGANQLRINELTYAAAQTTAVAAVPEPATWAMFILGFALVGGAMRSRKQQTKVRFAF